MAALNSQLASEALVDEATQRGSSDNISVKVVVLRPVALSDEIVGYFSARFSSAPGTLLRPALTPAVEDAHRTAELTPSFDTAAARRRHGRSHAARGLLPAAMVPARGAT